MNVTESAQLLLDHFEPIPESLWCEHTLISPDEKRCCALGHIRCQPDLQGRYYLSSKEVPGFGGLLDAWYIVFQATNINMTKVNDGLYSKYSQPTPKQRMVAFLQDVIKTRS